MPKRKLTKRTIDGLPKPEKATGVCYYDTDLAGFGIRVFPSGRKKFFVEYGPETRRRRMTIGAYGVLSLDEAKQKAKLLHASVIDGDDPLDDRQARRTVPSFGAWADEYMSGIRLRKKRPEIIEQHLELAKRRWRNMVLDSINQRDVETVMRSIRERGRTARKGPRGCPDELKGHTTANRWYTSIRACFQGAVDAGLIQVNPAAGISKFKESPPRDRVLTDDELNRFLEALNGETDSYTRAAFQMMIETGARLSEVLHARWIDIDVEQELWRIPSPKSGNPQRIPLPRTTVKLLQQLDPIGPYVIPGRDPFKPRHDLKGPWERIKKNARLIGVRIHDIRRTFGFEVARRHGLHIASKLLRHSSVRITETVYAPLGLAELKKATDQVSRRRGKVLKFEVTGSK